MRPASHRNSQFATLNPYRTFQCRNLQKVLLEEAAVFEYVPTPQQQAIQKIHRRMQPKAAPTVQLGILSLRSPGAPFFLHYEFKRWVNADARLFGENGTRERG